MTNLSCLMKKRNLSCKGFIISNIIREETEMMKILKHPGIVQLEETIESKMKYYIILEYVKGKDLFDYLVEKESLDGKIYYILMLRII